MRRLERAVRLVLRVTRAIAGEVARLERRVLANAGRAWTRLVDVVAEKGHEVERLPRHVFVGGVESVFVVLARDERELERRLGTGGGHRSEPADGAHGFTGVEPIEVPAPRFQPIDIGVNAVAQLGGRGCAALLDDL